MRSSVRNLIPGRSMGKDAKEARRRLAESRQRFGADALGLAHVRDEHKPLKLLDKIFKVAKITGRPALAALKVGQDDFGLVHERRDALSLVLGRPKFPAVLSRFRQAQVARDE
jgi:hypothetical protein